MTPAARVAAAIDILDQVLAGQATEAALLAWARGNRYAGSKDRAAVRDLVFDARRKWASSMAWGGAQTGRAIMAGCLAQQGVDLDPLFSGQGYAPAPLSEDERAQLANPPAPTDAIQHDVQDWVWDLLVRDHGSRAAEIAQALRQRAPVFLRVNLQRSTRAKVQDDLKADGIETVALPDSQTALEVVEGARKLRTCKALQAGVIELQDARSQAMIAEIPLPEKARVLDYCAGGGGKALALADRGAQVWAHDISQARLSDLPLRAQRAGVQIEVVTKPQLAENAPFDTVLCDVPCSGSGAWRRSPDGKWRLGPGDLSALCDTQQQVLAEAARLVTAQGQLVYATCSVLRDENAGAIARFLASQPGWQCRFERQWLPGPAGDGFYMARLERA